MIHSLSPATIQERATDSADPVPTGGITLSEFHNFLVEIQNQPAWRAKADKEMDYVDGNQLDSDILRRQEQLGIPPAIEPLIGPAIDAVLGFEAKTRTDWRLTSDNGADGDEVARALNYKLNQAERQSGADRACSDAFKTQVSVGLGWVEVSRDSNPFKYPYRCKTVHRNEIFWDWLSKEPDLSDARYLIRRRWTDLAQAVLKFPEKADVIRSAGTNGQWTTMLETDLDGGASTGLANSWDHVRGWSIEEQEWRDAERARVCLFEVWYRRWMQAVVIKTPDGRVVEYDKTNPLHVAAVASRAAKPQRVVIARMRRAYWLGPFLLSDEASPYRHDDFPYVPFWGKREDRTNVPYGAVRGMMFLQDNVNSAISKIRWGLSATRVERTKGAVLMRDDKFRDMVARPDADIILDAEHMKHPGARFDVKRDWQLNEQQYKMLGDSRMGIQRASGITAGFQGQQGSARSGVQESTQIEQTTQQLADMMDNFKFARTKVGELLLSMIIEDSIGKQEEVLVRGNAIRQDTTIVLNVPAVDPETGIPYRDNDVERIRLKVALDDVPSTPSFRAQQLQAMSEAFKAMPPEYQAIALPHLLNLMDVPDKDDIIKAIQAAQGHETPEQIQSRIDKAVDEALMKAQHDLKSRELDLKYNPERERAEIRKLVADTMLTTIQAAFSAMQAAGQITAVPAIAPIADHVMSNVGGFQPPTPAGVDPNFPVPAQPVQPLPVEQNTSPNFPARADTGMDGIETQSLADNQPAA